ncbi:MAG TPA: LytTR family DNA-binding domain-containing protein [Rhizomicrobium sp.]|nr:LytTR family DNA-binding domain-containing protein [Rhizomicrobium sp.]
MSQSEVSQLPVKACGDASRRIGDVWQWLGISGGALGTSGTSRRNFFYAYATTAVFAGVVNLLNVLTIQHENPRLGFLEPAIWEGSSWLSLLACFWIAWVMWRLAPLWVRPRWRLLLHIPGALVYSLAHVGGFIALRKLAYWALGSHYGNLSGKNFLYELPKDVLAYGLFIGGIALVGHLLRQQRLIQTPGQSLTFDIRDGAKLTRVRLSDILAITSAGNYVEFALQDGRRLLMRSPLSALESDLEGRGFVRTHRSWLVNSARVTALKPEGSGDYEISLGDLDVPLSRRFKAALIKLRDG